MAAEPEPEYHVLRTREAKEIRNCCADPVVLTEVDVAFLDDEVEIRWLHPREAATRRLTRAEFRLLITLFEDDEWRT